MQPATEQTFFNQKRLHRIFAVSSLALLISTVWMLAADSDRQWKSHQQRFQRIELSISEMRLQGELERSRRLQGQLGRELLAVQGGAANGDSPGDAVGPVQEGDRRRRVQEQDSRETRRLADQRRDLATKELEASRAALASLEQACNQQRSSYFVFLRGWLPWPGKKWLELPILDAFNSPRKIDNSWSEGLEQDFHFRHVRRFDRCTTCHQGIQKPPPRAADQPTYMAQRRGCLMMAPAANDSDQHDYETAFGLRLASAGILNPDDATVSFVQPGSPAARAKKATPKQERRGDKIRRELLYEPLWPAAAAAGEYGFHDEFPAGLMAGDVIEQVNGKPVAGRDQAHRLLGAAAASGQPVSLVVRRGMPQPYASHPRLDLFVGSLSPHNLERFACTVCHEGQGSATAFKWASHAPNDAAQREQWVQDYGWFDNPHWLRPMLPRRLAQSDCLKCHHDPAELAAGELAAGELAAGSEPQDGPAAKVVRGYRLIRKFGCYGCHEINGYDTAGKRIGPDLRLEPLLRQADEPGRLRKVGPTLRFVGRKLDSPLLADWIRNPTSLRPDTRMPRFFGLWDHLDDSSKSISRRYEPIEVLAMAAYLRRYSQDFEPLPPPSFVREGSEQEREADRPARIARGKEWFQTRGCLACHAHQVFPDAEKFDGPDHIPQGPNLSNTADKFSPRRNPNGRAWLYSWIKSPGRYSVRTLMPDMLLDPIQQTGQSGATTRRDPVDDLVEFLLSSSAGNWAPAEDASVELGEAQYEALDELALLHLTDAGCDVETAKQFLANGIPAARRDDWLGAEQELFAAGSPSRDAGAPPSLQRRLLYVGRKTIAARGCFACHDIPGCDDAKSIGVALADWGRKDPSQLAFEQIDRYLQRQSRGARADGSSPGVVRNLSRSQNRSGDLRSAVSAGSETRAERSFGIGSNNEERQTLDFFAGQIAARRRAGFAFQKLTAPRSYDFLMAGDKRYSERLRMPQFRFGVEDREAITTFVLGLVADPPDPRYVSRPGQRRSALIAGREVMDQYFCEGCHIREPETWKVAHPPGHFGSPAAGQPPFPFLQTRIAPDERKASSRADDRGLRTATLVGMPKLSGDGLPAIADEEGQPIEEMPDDDFDLGKLEYSFQLWSPAALDGEAYGVGEPLSGIPADMLDRRRLAQGGRLVKYLLPHVAAREKQVNPNSKGSDAWGWLPPSFVGQGAKTQPNWLHSFLLAPYVIRPASLLPMPKFNLSADEATKLVAYFAAADDSEYPYSSSQRRDQAQLDDADARYGRRLQKTLNLPKTPLGRRFEDAMKIVTDSSYCVRCHRVADHEPAMRDRDKAPDLARAYSRLRPGFVRDWIAKPSAILPYTPMPVNIPYDPADKANLGGVAQQLYRGNSLEQLEALVDLLLNYDVHAKQRSLPLPPPPPPSPSRSKRTE